MQGLLGLISFVAVFGCSNVESLTSKDIHNPTAVSASIIRALRASHPPTSPDGWPHLKLNLETDFFDPTTGLHSEGVWHNALVGIASLQSPSQPQDEYWQPLTNSLQIAQSLYQYSWDGVSFRRRCWSGQWDHSPLMESDGSTNVRVPDQANYYQQSPEHRCVQHGMALVFWSRLVRQLHQHPKEPLAQTIKSQHQAIARQFIQEFWDPSRSMWTTTSKRQGGGSLLRPSASSAKTASNYVPEIIKQDKKQAYFRAVDQAIAVLACLECLEVLDERAGLGGSDSVAIVNEELLVELILTTCHSLLAPTVGFGYGNVGQARTYLNLDRNRNFWHDGWVLLALIRARTYLWPNGTKHGEQQLQAMWHDFLKRYGHADSLEVCSSMDTSHPAEFDGTVWHWSLQQKSPADNVRYCGDNALAFAICRSLRTAVPEHGQFWAFVDQLRRIEIDGSSIEENGGTGSHLASVADAYPQVRLHPNTELAALLVWP